MRSLLFKAFILSFPYFCLSTILFAQETLPVTTQPVQNVGSVKGKVVDEKTGNTIDFATVSIIDPKDNTSVRGGQTDLQGNFTLQNIPFGSYQIQISFVGYSPFKKNIIIGKQEINAGTLKIKKGANSVLNEVVVTGKKDVIQLGIDRKIFNTDQSLVSQGGTATDLLATVPSVQVDLDGNVSLRGTSNVRILIDGKPSTFGGGNVTQLLQSLPANAIERIELITNPSSKYDVEGQSGLINIVLKKNQRLGFNGNVALSAGRFDNYNANTSINFRNEKWNISNNYSFRTGDRIGSGINNTRFIGNPSLPLTFSNQSSKSSDVDHTIRAGAEYFITDKTSIALSGNLNTDDENDTEDLNQLFLSSSNEVTDRGSGFNNSTEVGVGYDLNLDFYHKFKDPKEELTANFSFGNSVQDNNENIVQLFEVDTEGSSNRLNVIDQKNRNYNIQLDYIKPLNDKSKFEAGYRSTFRYNTEDQLSDTLNFDNNNYLRDFSLTSVFDLEDIVHAAYSNYQNQITENFGLQVGLRAEQAFLNTTINGFDGANNLLITPGSLDYFRVYPSIFLTQKFKGNNQFQLSYTRRVNRPRGWQVNPFPDVDDRFNIRIGNPNLRPEDIHSMEFSYAKFWNTVTFTSSFYLRQVNDVVQSIREQNPDLNGGTISRFYNIARNRALGLELIGRADITKGWNVTGNMNFFQSYFKGDENLGINDNDGFNWNGNLTSNVTFSKAFSGQVNMFYMAPRTMSQGTMKEMYSVDAGLKYDLLNNKVSLGLNMRDIFNTRRFSMLTDNGDFIQNWERRRQGSIYNMSISYRFGKQDNNQRRNTKRPDNNNMDEDMGI